jgi:hypothetical protein
MIAVGSASFATSEELESVDGTNKNSEAHALVWNEDTGDDVEQCRYRITLRPCLEIGESCTIILREMMVKKRDNKCDIDLWCTCKIYQSVNWIISAGSNELMVTNHFKKQSFK